MANNAVYWVVGETDPRNAGFRVRTAPLAEALKAEAIEPVVISMAEFSSAVKEIALKAAVVIVAKPTDTETYMCMKYLRSCGVRVVVDLFDNYFSWSSSLYLRAIPWHWLRNLEICSGVFTSTPFIAETIRKLGVADVCVVGDPLPTGWANRPDGDAWLDSKWRETEQLNLLWFGISENPYYHVGVEDLISWARVVAHMRDKLRDVRKFRLTICTNRVRAVETALVYFRQEGIDARFVLWTEDVCNELLDESHVVLLPTNLSGFGLSKTHNRCSDSLMRQCLVLASPHGTYRDIPGAVYRDVTVLCKDLASLNTQRIARGLVTSYEYLSKTFAVSVQAHRLAAFLLKPSKPEHRKKRHSPLHPPVLISGLGGASAAVKLSRRLGYMSAGLSHSSVKLNFDFLLVVTDDPRRAVTLKLSEEGRKVAEKASHAWLDDEDQGSREFELALTGTDVMLTLSQAEFSPLQDEIAALQPLVGSHTSLHSRLFDLHVALLMMALRCLGFRQFEFNATEAGGWRGYIAKGDPLFLAATKRLNSVWRTYEGGEWAIEQANATNRPSISVRQ